MKNEMWLIWKQTKTKKRFKVGILTYDNEVYTFNYVNPELNDAKQAGFNYFPGFEDVCKTYTDEEMFANIETRLPNPSRADYLEILNAYNLGMNSSKLEILKATKGRLITDNFEFVPSFNNSKIEFDIVGTSYCPDVKECKEWIGENDRLQLKLETDNIHDEHAVKVMIKKGGKIYHIGYVPRYYSKRIACLLKNNIEYSAMIQDFKLNAKFSNEYINIFTKVIFNTEDKL